MPSFEGVFIPFTIPFRGEEMQGFCGGPGRAPLATPDGDAIEDIEELLATAGLL